MAFDPFGDAASRGYQRNVAGTNDPNYVKLLEHDSFRRNILPALAALAELSPSPRRVRLPCAMLSRSAA